MAEQLLAVITKLCAYRQQDFLSFNAVMLLDEH